MDLALPVRLYLGYEWAHAGYDTLFGDPSWFSSTEPLTGFVGFAVSQAGRVSTRPWTTAGTPPSCAGRRRRGALHVQVISVGEFAIGILLILGLFTGIAAFLAGC